ncbi:toxin-antitoxin system YwqK family antitoxin [Croceimicrobium hydrocarbonivorans]|uniref:Toxin-antitoxin system YwqK family antitoxin n=1 Tax=Croceimicrobium hydrocarbonivorans TaxID=2761580 RepID=A0A7H0VHX6_9FLAO|nr:toxin-antitoxin system YwqK family antitoxin [Croceimicrobium hydrocarbonivorans]
MRFNKFYSLLLGLIVVACNFKAEPLQLTESRVLDDAIIVSSDSLILNRLSGEVFYRGLPFTGTGISRYPDGSRASSIEYSQGKKHGLYRKWFANASLSYEANYVEGKLSGESRSWWRNGKLRTLSNFKEGVPDGEQLQYYKSGLLFKKLQLAMGKESGLQQSWRENGKLFNNYEVKDGRIYGLKRSKLCFQLEEEGLEF